jgi:hypothetical protein
MKMTFARTRCQSTIAIWRLKWQPRGRRRLMSGSKKGFANTLRYVAAADKCKEQRSEREQAKVEAGSRTGCRAPLASEAIV